MSTEVAGYLRMVRAHYAGLVAKSNFTAEALASRADAEHVVGSYAQHERFDYERYLLAGIRVEPGAIALDYGCGPGRMLRRFAPLFARVDGIDVSPEVLAIAKQQCSAMVPPPQLFETTGHELPAPLDATYDLAFSVICLQHICVHSVRRGILEGLYRALKSGGVLTFQMGYGPGHPDAVYYDDNYTSASGTNGALDTMVLHPCELARDLDEIGFVQTVYSIVPTGPGDRHGAWIFVRGVKPGPSVAGISVDPDATMAAGFSLLVRDDAVAEAARQKQRTRGILGRYADLRCRNAAAAKDVVRPGMNGPLAAPASSPIATMSSVTEQQQISQREPL